MGMVKVSESVQGRESEQAKLVDRLDQKVMRVGVASIVCASVSRKLSGLLQAPKPILLLDTERVNPVVFPLGKCAVRYIDKAAGQDAGKKRTLYCNGADTSSCSTRKWADVQRVSDREKLGRIVSYERKQMTGVVQPSTGALSGTANWESIDWLTASQQVKRLQRRIAKATKDQKWGKVKALQWLLTHSRSAKLLAVKKVTSTRGSKTPGIDGEVWSTSNQKLSGADSLKRRGYQPKPLRRIYIPKSNGQKRSLRIPCIKDRAFQALHLLA